MSGFAKALQFKTLPHKDGEVQIFWKLSVCSRVTANLTLMLDLCMIKDNIIQQGCYTYFGLVLSLCIGQTSTMLMLHNKHTQILSDSQYNACVSYSEVYSSADLGWDKLNFRLNFRL